jgi:hypothetical protein
LSEVLFEAKVYDADDQNRIDHWNDYEQSYHAKAIFPLGLPGVIYVQGNHDQIGHTKCAKPKYYSEDGSHVSIRPILTPSMIISEQDSIG